jgi:energy-coupling factor transporter ATP-binding protein EcfA2
MATTNQRTSTRSTKTTNKIQPAAIAKTPKVDIRSNDRIAIFGGTGQGKSKVAMWIFHMMKAQKKIILNSKPDKDLLKRYPNWQRSIEGPIQPGITHIARFFKSPEGIEGWDDILSHWTEGNILFYFDELPNHANANNWSGHLQQIYQTGRTFGVGSITCAQRPVGVPNFTISESQHVFIAYTQLKSDREKLEGATGVKWDILRHIPPYHFGYYSQRLGMTEPVILPPVPLI